MAKIPLRNVQAEIEEANEEDIEYDYDTAITCRWHNIKYEWPEEECFPCYCEGRQHREWWESCSLMVPDAETEAVALDTTSIPETATTTSHAVTEGAAVSNGAGSGMHAKKQGG